MNLEPNSPHDPATDSCRIPVAVDDNETGSWLNEIDGLDKLAIGSVILLLVAALVIIFTFNPEAATNAASRPRKITVAQVINPDLEKKIDLAGNLLAGGNLEKSRVLIEELIKNFPYEGTPYMLMGDFYLHEQKTIEAMLEFQKGIDLNPDFLDKKTKVFQGKKIKNTLAEVKNTLEKGLSVNPGDETLQRHLKSLYYMQRKVAGSCG